jgi:hypothetical protein
MAAQIHNTYGEWNWTSRYRFSEQDETYFWNRLFKILYNNLGLRRNSEHAKKRTFFSYFWTKVLTNDAGSDVR